MLIDTHVHYNLEPLFSENQKEKKQVGFKEKDGYDVWEDVQTWAKHWEKAQSEGVSKSIVVGTNFFTSTIATMVAEKATGLYASVGCHPNEYHEAFLDAKQHHLNSFDSLFEDVQTDREELELIVDNKLVVAIGEIGLDYYRLPHSGEERDVTIQLQKEALEKQIDLAQKRDLPIILHVRDKETPEDKIEGNAYWDALNILQESDVKNFTLHCVSGPLSYVKAAVEMGGYMGFDGNITYPNAQPIRDIFQIVPEDSRLLETDAPYLAPQGFRGKVCEPWMIVNTAEFIEQELQADRESFTKNAERLFSFT